MTNTSDSLNADLDDALDHARSLAAKAAFERYDFGDDVTVEAFNGFQYVQTNLGSTWTSAVFVKRDDDQDAPTTKLTFVVDFQAGSGVASSSYAHDANGTTWGWRFDAFSPAEEAPMDRPRSA